jgi:hypothetical protein
MTDSITGIKIYAAWTIEGQEPGGRFEVKHNPFGQLSYDMSEEEILKWAES